MDIYKAEPYVLAADVYTNINHVGRGGWSWYTGASGRYYRTGIEEILGLNLSGNFLIVNPKLPSFWENCKVRYTFNSKTLVVLDS